MASWPQNSAKYLRRYIGAGAGAAANISTHYLLIPKTEKLMRIFIYFGAPVRPCTMNIVTDPTILLALDF